MRSYELEQACSISEMAYLYEAYKLEQACSISELAYLYEAYELEQACSISERVIGQKVCVTNPNKLENL